MARSEFTPAEMLLSTKQEVADSHQSLKQEIREGRLGIYACGNAIIDEAGRLNEKPRPIKSTSRLPAGGAGYETARSHQVPVQGYFIMVSRKNQLEKETP